MNMFLCVSMCWKCLWEIHRSQSLVHLDTDRRRIQVPMHLRLAFWIFLIEYVLFYVAGDDSRISPIFQVRHLFWQTHKSNRKSPFWRYSFFLFLIKFIRNTYNFFFLFYVSMVWFVLIDHLFFINQVFKISIFKFQKIR